MEMKHCVCTEIADGYGYSLAVLEQFDTKEEAVNYLQTSSGLYADFYYIKEIWFNR